VSSVEGRGSSAAAHNAARYYQRGNDRNVLLTRMCARSDLIYASSTDMKLQVERTEGSTACARDAEIPREASPPMNALSRVRTHRSC
jgi:hypothetical protein